MPATHGDGADRRPDTLVRQLLAGAGRADWLALPDILHPKFTITEPACLPWGGTHSGIDAYIGLLTRMGGLFDIAFTRVRVITEGSDAVLTCLVEFTRRTTGRTVVMPTVEMFTTAGDLLISSEVYFADPTRILAAIGET
ncbi:nuclear transport factor 2 family protein [Nocardia seriolae]|uniref:SnoaL-like domain-containing protein n=1 Tax=Nocardia seriolae TaxID=37332 RepID=A0A0B8NM83_9NOCA|nr:nuclear transport factor 2 family protein [Nocardia seriolae]APA95936.1 hypothetical protein NS506_01868 [Nocardia seriolae]MTJ65970.1 hypothetical protein [Nocardia seriolae]MTJ75718.1 hypothetical protein [Nocardia seriolae]MTJ86104.1 hypothetical protein [Nocardia seriolae]MTK30100.1 hypothetical protein [Nocardia seriolae]